MGPLTLAATCGGVLTPFLGEPVLNRLETIPAASTYSMACSNVGYCGTHTRSMKARSIRLVLTGSRPKL
jgi:hypothetical protein